MTTYIEAIVAAKSMDELGGEYNLNTETIRVTNQKDVDILLAIKQDLQNSGKKLVRILSLKVVPNCWGCRTEQPNQLAHMDPDGCLYIPSDDE